jgi:tRNA (cytidine/uridine-2'-O-)-methyltransferase
VLHLIKPLGFSLDSRQVKRAGLDYWHRVSLRVWNSFDEFIEVLSPSAEEVALFSKTGGRSFWEMPSPPRLFLIFGSETKGLPEAVLSAFPGADYHIPITSQIRSLNLSTAVGIALYESLRGTDGMHAY